MGVSQRQKLDTERSPAAEQGLSGYHWGHVRRRSVANQNQRPPIAPQHSYLQGPAHKPIWGRPAFKAALNLLRGAGIGI